MKKLIKIGTVLLCFLLICTVLTACGGDGGGKGWNPKGETVTLIAKYAPASYYCVYGTPDELSQNAAILFKNAFTEQGVNLGPVSPASGAAPEKEILFGETDREASKIAKALLDEKSAATPNDFHWVFYYQEGTLAIIANSETAYSLAVKDFTEKYINDNGVVFKDTLKEHGTLTLADYEEELAELERIEAEKKKEENEQLIPYILSMMEEQNERLNKNVAFRGATPDITAKIYNSWGEPAEELISEHPRLMLTRDDLPGIRKALRENTASNTLFLSYIERSTDGSLSPVKTPYNPSNPQNAHNYNATTLEIVMAKALAYLIYDDPYYGYQAIYGIKNYLETLDIQYIAGDQYRQFGDVGFGVACVYDWCYDLLTEEDKTQIISATEKKIFAGANYKGDNFEIGFPPTKQGSFTGHGSEYQLLRDYLSFAVAIYDENPSWYNYIGARFYNDYVPSRNYYFECTGIASQGTNYLSLRHTATFYSAWIITKATGKNPYKGLENTMPSFFSYEYAEGYIFGDGDGATIQTISGFRDAAFFAAYLYGDATMLAQAEHILGTSQLTHVTQGLGTSVYMILRGTGLEPAENRHEGLPLIQYNGSPLGQYVVHGNWADGNSASIFMKMKERNTANHEHGDAGHFQIYYKGMLTNDSGCYDNYTHVHTQQYHKKTVAHNGLLVYNDTIAKNDRYYTGSQKTLSESSTLDAWLKYSEADVGKITGRQHAYTDKTETAPLYAYIAGDITLAYDASTVNYVGRRMLTVYTGDETYPMAFFVYDDIEADKERYVKSFLLQISSKERPDVDTDEQTVVTENGGGRLVLTCLSDNVTIELHGGRSYKADGSYDPEKSKNYLIGGKQLPSLNGKDDGHWGRIEIVSYGKATSTYMNVMYVTDSTNRKSAEVDKITDAVGVEGGEFNEQIVALFASSRERATSTLSAKISGSGNRSYYVSGVKEGQWKVTVDGKSVGTFEATAEGGLLTFTAPAGEIVISPAK